MDYSQALAYLDSLIDLEKAAKPKYPDSLDQFRNFLKTIDNPHKSLKGFLIAGTKGKGSTAYLIDEICSAMNYSTGRYTSPHLTSYRERICINGKNISENRFASLISVLSTLEGKRSVFEVLTAAAFLLFNRKGVNYPIFEVGLGGRLDTTNVIDPLVSIITPVSIDHTNILGDTVEKIATEKAGILRENGINISSPQLPSVREILKNKANGNIKFIDNYKVINVTEKRTIFEFNGHKIHLGLIGKHQAMNASLALSACIEAGIPLNMTKVKGALSKATFPGRFQIVKKKPYIILDGAHNIDSIRVLKEAIQDVFNRKVLLVYSCLVKKDVAGMLHEIKPIVKKIYPTTILYPRTIKIEEIIKNSENEGLEIANVIENPIEALKKAMKDATKDDIILITGSFYLLGDILQNSPWK
jgi:dihydrofolate synthase/folylpolyglutamate synthase